jgi:hypothetical protein
MEMLVISCSLSIALAGFQILQNKKVRARNNKEARRNKELLPTNTSSGLAVTEKSKN